MGNFASTEQQNRFPLKCRKVKKYGWIPDIPDQRDIWTSFPKTIVPLSLVDLRKSDLLSSVYDQGPLGSSVTHALISAYEYDLNKAGIKSNVLSRQFIYYNQRLIAGTVECDTGASIRDAIKVLNRLGSCSEELYPYDPNFFMDRPTDEAYENAYQNKQPIQYRKVRLVLEDITKSLTIGIPVILGFTVYESFEHPDVTRTGIMPVPKLGEKIVGSHTTLIVGYDSHRKFLLCRNSWGVSWGQGGYFWMPFSFVNSRNCSDLWIISTGLKKGRGDTNLSTNLSTNLGTNLGTNSSSKPVTQREVPREISIEKVPETKIEKVPEFKEDDEEVSLEDIEEDLNAV